MISNNGWIIIRKIEGDTYVRLTEEGEKVSTKMLQALISYEELQTSYLKLKKVLGMTSDCKALKKGWLKRYLR